MNSSIVIGFPELAGHKLDVVLADEPSTSALRVRTFNHNPVIAESLPGYVVATTAHRNQ